MTPSPGCTYPTHAPWPKNEANAGDPVPPSPLHCAPGPCSCPPERSDAFAATRSPSQAKIRSKTPPNGRLRPTPVSRRRRTLVPVVSAAARAPKPSWPPDLEATTLIRFRSHQIRALQSESKRPDLNVMVRPISFAKEPSHYLENNPQSWCVQKNLQFGPEINTQPPELFRF